MLRCVFRACAGLLHACVGWRAASPPPPARHPPCSRVIFRLPPPRTAPRVPLLHCTRQIEQLRSTEAWVRARAAKLARLQQAALEVEARAEEAARRGRDRDRDRGRAGDGRSGGPRPGRRARSLSPTSAGTLTPQSMFSTPRSRDSDSLPAEVRDGVLRVCMCLNSCVASRGTGRGTVLVRMLEYVCVCSPVPFPSFTSEGECTVCGAWVSPCAPATP
jgi:hypothetical protein